MHCYSAQICFGHMFKDIKFLWYFYLCFHLTDIQNCVTIVKKYWFYQYLKQYYSNI